MDIYMCFLHITLDTYISIYIFLSKHICRIFYHFPPIPTTWKSQMKSYFFSSSTTINNVYLCEFNFGNIYKDVEFFCNSKYMYCMRWMYMYESISWKYIHTKKHVFLLQCFILLFSAVDMCVCEIRCRKNSYILLPMLILFIRQGGQYAFFCSCSFYFAYVQICMLVKLETNKIYPCVQICISMKLDAYNIHIYYFLCLFFS